ncbi:hypothetical protein NFI96_015005 [Prochilodus magdalenae]|nr:hypothetical protein NFI96_015005 [Prochilodus magdalenae]
MGCRFDVLGGMVGPDASQTPPLVILLNTPAVRVSDSSGTGFSSLQESETWFPTSRQQRVGGLEAPQNVPESYLTSIDVVTSRAESRNPSCLRSSVAGLHPTEPNPVGEAARFDTETERVGCGFGEEAAKIDELADVYSSLPALGNKKGLTLYPEIIHTYCLAQRNERESIRQKLALGSFYDDGPAFFTGCSKGGKNCLSSRLQNGVNLQMCFVNDSSSDKDSDAEDSRTETSLDTPLSPMSKQSSSLSDRDTGEEDLEQEDCEFWRVQRRLQEEARGKFSPGLSSIKLPHLPHISESLMKRSLRPVDMRDMSLGQLQVITNDLHSQIQGLNEELVQLLLLRDELHVEQDAMLVDVEDLTR